MEDDDVVTPTVTHPETVEPTHSAPPPVDPPTAHEHVQHTHEELEQRIADLEGTLNSLISMKPDSSPVRKPWTHRRIMGR
jgi:hypothetical protein